MPRSHRRRYVIKEFQAPNRVVLHGDSKAVRAVDIIEFTALSDTQTRVDYTADLTLKGFRRPFIVFVKGALNELGRNAMTGLEKKLNS